MRLSLLCLLAALFWIVGSVAQTPEPTEEASELDSSEVAEPSEPPLPESQEQDNTPPIPTSSAAETSREETPTSSADAGGSESTTTTTKRSPQGPPDVHLKVPELSVGLIELDVDNLRADVNLNAEVARLVQINAGVHVSVEKVNITIADVSAELDLVVRLGHLADIVNRTLASLDLNPALVSLLDSVSGVVDSVIGVVDGLLGSITQGDTVLNFLIDNLGNIVQEVTTGAGDAVSTIVGNWQTNMTATGQERNLANGLVEKTFSYEPLDALVNIVFNSLDQIVSARVVKGGDGDNSDEEGDDDSGDEDESPSSTSVEPSATA